MVAPIILSSLRLKRARQSGWVSSSTPLLYRQSLTVTPLLQSWVATPLRYLTSRC